MATITGTSGPDTLVGTATDDTITGLGGNDTISPLLGDDSVDGGDGTDLLNVDYSASTGAMTFTLSSTSGTVTDTVNTVTFGTIDQFNIVGTSQADVFNLGTAFTGTLVGGAGTDTVNASFSHTLAADIENLVLGGTSAINGTGNTLANTLTGNGGANTLTGLVGNDTLAGGSGNDTMVGGAGDDLYVVLNTGDVVTEVVAEGTDTVQSTITHTLSDNVENLTLTGSLLTSGTGNSLNNILTGNSVANTLSGLAGADTMIGGIGNDVYIVDDVGDVVTETSSGSDTIQSSVTYTLPALVEKLTLTGISAINATGNTLANTLTGNTAANVLNGGAGIDAMIGGTGDDTYVVDNIADTVTEGSSAGTDVVQSSVTFTLGANVENLTLTGASAINGTGNTLGNSLTGNNGANRLDGKTGADTMAGGTGNDTYVIDNASDAVTEAADAGTDTVESSLTHTLGANFEKLTLTGSTAINGTGNTLANTLTGNSGVNVLDGGVGADTMVGGFGNDTYIVDDTGDETTETNTSATEIDTVQASVSYSLVPEGRLNIERLTLTGTSAINGVGNNLANLITGNDGANTLNGKSGKDTMVGGLGNDTYIVDNTTDVTTETSTLAAEIDTVQASVSVTLSTNIENLTLTQTLAINGTGNASANIITGNSGANVLDGGAGNDTMIGGLGNDTYVVDSTGDVVTETSGLSNEIDTVLSSVDFTIGANIENLTLTGTAAIDGTGNSLKNTITGNSGANVLDGGSGADKMIGGSGADIYMVDNANDSVSETSSSGGTDEVVSTVKFTLPTNVENLTLAGTSNIDGKGNSIANALTGNDGNNVLDGLVGADAMSGGLGNDTYVVDNAGDSVTEGASAGTDLVKTKLSFTLGNNLENLTLTGSAAVNGTGNSLDNVIRGNGAANALDGGTGQDTMIGGVGNDTYTVNSSGDVTTETDESAFQIDTVLSSISHTLGDNVENLTLTGASGLDGTGNASKNTITGNSGANDINGLGGADTMVGDAGNDTYTVNVSGDKITELAGGGTDSVSSSATYTLGANVENLTLTGTSAINGFGSAVDNTITGNSAANILNGLAGDDTMVGNDGNDTYFVDSSADVVTEAADSGTDTVKATVDFDLGNNVEKLILTGTSAIDGTGNGLDNTITGNSAANVLDGSGGADTMIGGNGNDTYVVDDVDDVVKEAGGVDLIQSSVTYTLPLNVDNLTLTGSSNLDGTGNAAANTLTGNSGANLLTGGLGKDTMIGGDGNDTYDVDDTNDVVTEASAEGTDLVRSKVTYTIGGNVEKITLTGAGNINASGNSLANILTGNSGRNTLDGDAGADDMTGGNGNDTYIVDNVSDSVTETNDAATQIDTVESSVTFTLPTNVEKLTLTGTSAIDGTGNGLKNTMTGNSGANELNGRGGKDILIGGAGADILTGANTATGGVGEIDKLTGGNGADLFVLGNSTEAFYNDGVNTNAGKTDYAHITDFTVGTDVLQLNGNASQYVLGSSVSGLGGSGLYRIGATDELIAVLNSGTELTKENTIDVATFV